MTAGLHKLSAEELAEATAFRDRAQRDAAALEARALRWQELENAQPPEREWAIGNWLGMNYVTLLAGPGGSGKTAVMQTLLSAIATGQEVVDAVPKPRRTLMWFGEDDADEVWRRQVAIGSWLGVPLADFSDRFFAIARPSDDITLAGEVNGQFLPTPELKRLKEQIGDLKAEVVCLDSVARIFGGSENNRHQVTQFVAWLNEAASPTRAAVVPIGHPAKAEGSEFSGSTAWEASVRARLYFGFRLPDQKEDPENPPDPASPLRILAKRKTNYSVKDFRLVKWQDGAMIPQTPEPGARSGVKSVVFLADEAVHLLRRLKAMGIDASHASNSPSFLPRAAQQAGLLNGSFTVGDVKRGLAEALRTGRLKVDTVGLYANRSPRKGLVEAHP